MTDKLLVLQMLFSYRISLQFQTEEDYFTIIKKTVQEMMNIRK